jgi:hypothetical protein
MAVLHYVDEEKTDCGLIVFDLFVFLFKILIVRFEVK